MQKINATDIYYICNKCGKNKPQNIIKQVGWIHVYPLDEDYCPGCHNQPGKARQRGLEILNKKRTELTGAAQNVQHWQRRQEELCRLIFHIEREIEKYGDCT